MLLGHKESRFLIPIAPLVLSGLIFVIPEKWFSKSASGNPFTGHARWVRWGFYLFLACNFVALLAASVRLPRPAISTHHFIYSIEPNHFEFYSLGATHYHMVTGRMPFEGETMAEVLTKVLFSRPPLPEAVRPGVSYGTSRVISRMMAKDPGDRYQTMNGLIPTQDTFEHKLGRAIGINRLLR